MLLSSFLPSRRRSYRPSRRAVLSVEPLEGRDAPATLVNGTRLTYQDVDGDNVSVTLSKAVLTAANVNTIFTFAAGNVDGKNATPQQLTKIDLTSLGAAASGLNISTSATRSATTGGDGFGNVGIIDATGIDLGQVTIDGDLAKITAGDAKTTTPGLNGLTADSLGRMLFGSGAIAPDLHTVIQGKLGVVNIKRDVFGADIEVQGGADGKIGSLTIGGSLIGLDADNSARILTSGDIGPVKIGGNIEGGSQADTAQILSKGRLGSVTIGGSIHGGSGHNAGSIGSALDMGRVTVAGNIEGGLGDNSGMITSLARCAGVSIGGSLIGGAGSSSGQIIALSDMGPMTVRGNLQGGAGSGTGAVGTGGNFASLIIGGSLVGGTGNNSGSVQSLGSFGALTIGGNLVGGSATGTADLTDSGSIKVKRIASVTIGGSLFAGRTQTSGTFQNNGAIRAEDDIGSITIKGSMVGTPFFLALISARGQAVPTATADLAIGRISVGGRVEFASIIAGVDLNLNPVNADAQIGAVTVGGDWMASSISAGAFPADPFFGNADDVKINGAGVKDVAGVVSRIASVTIGGHAVGTGGFNTDHYGIVAESIGSVRINGSTFTLQAGTGNDDFFLGITSDFKVNEI